MIYARSVHALSRACFMQHAEPLQRTHELFQTGSAGPRHFLRQRRLPNLCRSPFLRFCAHFQSTGEPHKKFSQHSKQGHALTAAPSLAFQANHEPFIAKFHQQSKKNFLFGVDTWKIVPIVRVCFSGTHSQGRRS